MKTKRLFISIACVLVLLCVFVSFLQVMPVSSEQNKTIQRVEVPSGTTVKTVSLILKEKKLIRNSLFFYVCARYSLPRILVAGTSEPFSLKSGVYQISNSMTYAEIFKILSSGQQEYIRVSFPEGLTISKIAQKLEDSGVCSAEEFKVAAKDKNLLFEYKIPGESFEGFLFPDTYFFTPKMSGQAVARKMVENFFEKLKTIKNSSSLTMSELYSDVVLASIVEREYRIDSEAPLIASVFRNRLKHNIGLYSCATIEYILTEIQGKPHPDVITYADLAIDSPYNTYKWAGLTPGPISNPGVVALDAAINSAKTDYYFFRLVDANAGRHVFSKDFSTHVNEGYIYSTKKSGN